MIPQNVCQQNHAQKLCLTNVLAVAGTSCDLEAIRKEQI